MRFYTLLSGFLLVISSLKAQTITINDVVQEDKRLVLSYDLPGKNLSYNVEMFYSTDDGVVWNGPLASVAGDAGSYVKSGKAKQIIWSVLGDATMLKGDKIRFRLKARGSSDEGSDIYIYSDKSPSLLRVKTKVTIDGRAVETVPKLVEN